MEQILKTMLENVRAKTPLVHNITNYVTVNDVANVLLAAGGSPIMSDDADDVEDITSICGGLNINIGTLNKNTIPSMFLAGKKANELGHIVLLDPVGAGASRLRTDTANRLMREVRFDAVRGNISEIKTLCTGSGTTKGVDADAVDAVTEANLDDGVALVKAFARQAGCIIAVTGAIDLVHPQRPPGDEPHHRYGLPALGADDGVPRRKPRAQAGSRGCRRVHDGARGRDRLGQHAARRRQQHLPQPHHRCHFQHDRRRAGGRSQI